MEDGFKESKSKVGEAENPNVSIDFNPLLANALDLPISGSSASGENASSAVSNLEIGGSLPTIDFRSDTAFSDRSWGGRVEHHRLPGSVDRYRYYRGDNKQSLEHETKFEPTGRGSASWYRPDGTKSHDQHFSYWFDPSVRSWDPADRLKIDLKDVLQFDASGKGLEHKYLMDRFGNVNRALDYEAGKVSQVSLFRSDGTLRARTNYDSSGSSRHLYTKADDIHLKADQHLFRKP